MKENDLYLQMYNEVPNQQYVIKQQLPIKNDKDTSFDIYFDIYNDGQKEYLYIQLVENSAVAPFYYFGCYTIEDLCKLHRIFRAENMEQVKEDLEKLFKKKLVKLFYDTKSDGIIMEIRPTLFATEYPIHFELEKKMIPENEKVNKLITLYDIEKTHLAIAKEIFDQLKKLNLNIDPQIFDDLKSHFDICEEKPEIGTLGGGDSELEDEKLKAIFGLKKKKGFIKQNDKGFIAEVYFSNTSDKAWPEKSIEFKINDDNLDIKCEEITYPPYEIAIQQSGEFYFLFNKNSKPGQYILLFDVYFEGVKLKDTQLKLKIEIPEPDD